MKNYKYLLNTISASLLVSLSLASASHADNALFHSGQASVNSARAVGHGAVAVGKSAATIVAVPFIAIGTIGGLSSYTGDTLLDVANAPLEIGDEIVTAGPSPDALISSENPQ